MYVIGLDIGTTCAKALLVNENGQILATKSKEYPLIRKGQNIEQDPNEWIEATVFVIRETIKGIDISHIKGISMSTQGGSTVPVNETRDFLGNAITWMDTRAIEEAKEIEKMLGGEYIYRTTGWKINPALDAAKIRHLKGNGKSKKTEQAVLYLTTLEIMNQFLTGNPVIDPTNAAIRQLYNIEKECWDEKLLEVAGITADELPNVLPTGAYIGGLTEEAAQQMGLPAGVAVFNGAHDQYCASLGAGVVESGNLLLSAGTTWVLMGVGKTPLFTKSYIAPGKHPVKGLYGAMASLVCSGASLQWYKNEFLSDDFALLNQEADKRREKAKDLFFYPYLAGANYPIWNLNAKGAFTGVSLEHDRFDFARAIMEGVAFGVRRGLEDFKANGCEIHKIIIMGGASKSDVWCQLIASITSTPILKLSESEVCAMGAAMIAGCSLGIFADYKSAADTMVQVQHLFEPLSAEVDFYNQKYQNYIRFWEHIQAYYEEDEL